MLGEEHAIFIQEKKGVKPQPQAPQGFLFNKDLSGDVCACKVILLPT